MGLVGLVGFSDISETKSSHPIFFVFLTRGTHCKISVHHGARAQWERMYDAQMNKEVVYDVANGKSWFPATHLHTLI